MKNPIKVTIIILLVFSIFGCEDESIPVCVQGKVVGYEYCTNAVLIQVLNGPIESNDIVYYDNNLYENIISAPGRLGEYGQNEIYFRYRQYSPEDDFDLFKPTQMICNHHNYGFDVSTVVITHYSTENCP